MSSSNSSGIFARWGVLLIIGATVAGLTWMMIQWRAEDPTEVAISDDTPSGSSRQTASTANAALPVQSARSESEELLRQLIASSNPGFTGPEVCRECHQEKYDSASQTRHFRACRVVTPDQMAGTANSSQQQSEEALVQVTEDGPQFEMWREGDQYWMLTHRKAAGETGIASPIRSSVDLILGSGGKFDDVFLSWREDGAMVELPMVWLYPSQEWVTSHFDPLAPGDCSRPLTVRCLECHNTWVGHRRGTANQYRRDGAILGVTCESCHGPCQDHVRFHRSEPQTTEAKFVVHPGRLPREQLIDVCAQCHSNAMKRKVPAFSHRPDQPVEASFKELVSQHHEDDHVANQTQFMRRSACFQGDASMTCITCHDPHESDDAPMQPRDACYQCHGPDDCGERPQLPEAVRDQCIDCHMPPYIKINVNFMAEDDPFVAPIRRWQHRIGVYPEARQEVLRRWHAAQPGEEHEAEAARLADQLIEHYLEEAQQAVDQNRFVGAIAACREALRVDDRPVVRKRLEEVIDRQMQLEDLRAQANRLVGRGETVQAISVLQSILEIKPDDAIAHGRLGTALAEQGRMDEARGHWEQVVQSDPNDAYGLGMLAWIAMNQRDFQRARELYEQADAIEPYEAKIHYQLGMIEALTGNLPQAIDYLQQCLEIEPLHPGALEAIISAYRQQGRPQDAVPHARAAVALTARNNPNALMVLAETSAESGDFPAAREAALEARQLAERVDSGLVDRIDQKLLQYQQAESSVRPSP